MNRSMGRLAALYFTVIVALTGAEARAGEDCPMSLVSDPPRAVYVCASGLVIEAEAPEAVDLALPDVVDGTASMEVTDRAVWVQVTPGGSFQIATPYAIAAVRGTTFVVDTHDAATDVFVIEGVVAVFRPDGSDEVTLEAGDGVTFTAQDRSPVRQWPVERVTALLARFAR